MSTTTGAICLGDSVTLTVKGVPQTVEEFEDNLDNTFEKITSYGGSHYFLKKDPMPWTSAKSLIKSLGSGASMYVINSNSEETEIYNKLLSMGYAGPDSTGNDDNHFWLGLRQIDALKNGAIDQGWVWLDGRLLTPLQENWNTTTASEPNDYSCVTCPPYVEDGR